MLGIDLRESAVSRLILSGEPAGSIPQTKALIEEQWGAKAFDTAGMTEIGTIMVFECAHQPGGTHIIEDHVIEEVLDPVTLEPVGFGERGERVVTSFGRGAIPLMRYRTGDLVCKRARLDVRVRSRLRHLRGRDPRPRRRHEAHPRHQRLPASDRGDRARVPGGRRVPDRDHPRGDSRRDHAARRDEARLAGGSRGISSPTRCTGASAHAHEGLNFQIERAGAGELPRFELKAKRMIDLREAPWGGEQMTVDLLGSELSPSEQRLLAVYEELKALCAEDLPPNALAASRRRSP